MKKELVLSTIFLLNFQVIIHVCSESNSISDIWIHLGWKSLEYISDKRMKLRNTFKQASSNLIQVRFGKWTNNSDSYAVWDIEDSNKVSEIESFLHLWTQKCLAFSKMILTDKVKKLKEEVLDRANLSLGIYVAERLSQDQYVIYRVQTFRRNKAIFSKITFKYKYEIDLKGSELLGVSLDSQYWISFQNDRKPKGFAVEILNLLSKEYNFTLRIEKEASNSWGQIPINGMKMSDPEAVFGGVFGLAVNQSVDILPANWIPTMERHLWLDFTQPFYSNKLRCYAIQSEDTIDATLFKRPMTNEAWFGVLLSIIFVALIALVSVKVVKQINPWSYQITAFTGN